MKGRALVQKGNAVPPLTGIHLHPPQSHGGETARRQCFVHDMKNVIMVTGYVADVFGLVSGDAKRYCLKRPFYTLGCQCSVLGQKHIGRQADVLKRAFQIGLLDAPISKITEYLRDRRNVIQGKIEIGCHHGMRPPRRAAARWTTAGSCSRSTSRVRAWSACSDVSSTAASANAIASFNGRSRNTEKATALTPR